MRTAKGPSPISWLPSQLWDGDDGPWSSFFLRVGTPEQIVRVLPSTAGSATWVIVAEGCDGLPSTCDDSRGNLFNTNQSISRTDLGDATLNLELNLGRNESGAYSLDKVALGMSDDTGGVTLDNQTVVGIATDHYWTGMLGLSPQPANISNFSQPHASILTTLKAQSLIPSLSWSYTAGAKYKSKGVFGSLTFGGSDLSRYTPSNVSFNLAPDITRDLVVGLQAITATYPNQTSQTLLPSPILAFVDSTVPWIYLPVEACQQFEAEFGLTWNETTRLYLMDDGLRQRLMNLNPQFKFTVGDDKNGGNTIDIILPYSSFDLVAQAGGLVDDTTSYFPLRRGDNETQYTLGRAFLQEAYLIADYERRNFTIAQSQFNESAPMKIVPIPWNSTTTEHHGDRRALDMKAILGISLGLLLFVVVLIVMRCFLIYRRRRNPSSAKFASKIPPEQARDARPLKEIPIQEIYDGSVRNIHLDGPVELHELFKAELQDQSTPSGSGNELRELSSSTLTSSGLVPQSASQSVVHEEDFENTNAITSLRSKVGDSRELSTDTSKRPRPSASAKLKLNKQLPRIPSLRKDTVIRSSIPYHDSAIVRASASSIKAPKPVRHHETIFTEMQRSLTATPMSESVQISTTQIAPAGRTLAPRSSQKDDSERTPSTTDTYAAYFDYDVYQSETFVEEAQVRAREV